MDNTKGMRKSFTFLLAVVLTVSTLSISASAKSFSDVSSSHYALDGINYVSDNGFMLGTSSTSFSPNTAITRAMLLLPNKNIGNLVVLKERGDLIKRMLWGSHEGNGFMANIASGPR